MYRAIRFSQNPIIHAELDEDLGRNINGPSLVRVPERVLQPLGRYCPYFAHYHGTFRGRRRKPPASTSSFGAAHEAVCQLRDPAIYEDDDRLYLLYTGAGETNICMAELTIL